MAKVLFISTNFIDATHPPLAPALFTALLREAGHEIYLFDTTYYNDLGNTIFHSKMQKRGVIRDAGDSLLMKNIKETTVREDLGKVINEFSPDVVMISIVEAMYNQMLGLLDIIRPFKILTVVGGVFPTFAPDFLINHDGVDMVCVGEGENAVAELCNRIDKGADCSDIPNLYVKAKDGSITRNPLGPPVDIDMLPSPDYSLFEEARFYRPMGGSTFKAITIETGRGCPYSCTYCSSPALNKLYKDIGCKLYRRKSMDKIYEDICRQIKKYSPTYIHFYTDTFLACTEREFDEFIEMYSGIRLPFWMQTRPETVDERKIERLCDAGLHRVSIGIEHGNEEFRRKMLNKRTKNETIKRAAEIIYNNKPGILTVNNMVGFPDETRELAMDTASFNNSIAKYADSITCCIMVPFMGTELRKLAVEKGYMKDSDVASRSLADESMLDMPQFPKKDISGISKVFSLYARFEKSRWPEIREAEGDSPEAECKFEQLMVEYNERFR